MAFRLVGNKFVNADDPQFQIYNAMGNGTTNTNDGGDNFFTKRAKSIENAVGTTGAALYETGGNLLPAVVAGLTGGDYTSHRSKLQNEKTQNLMNEGNAKMAGIYKKYGYDNEDAYYDASNREMGDLYKKYGYDNGENYWEDRYLAKTRGDNAALEALDRERADIISRMSAQDAERANYYDTIQRELTGQAQANVDAMNKNAREYEDYVKNNYVSQKLGQDRGKFLGSAINTLSTGADVLLPGAGVAFNAAQGGVEGIADELEQNGLQNFDWGRAGQNAAIGAVTGGVVGGLNKGLSNRLAKNGGNLFRGNNALTSGFNNLGSKTALGRMGSTIATGVGRGALSGAVGGATGGALSAGMNNGNVLEGAFQGAAQGLQQGAMAGGVMAGANMALNATPGVGNVMRNLNQAGEDWKNSGNNFDERLTNTLTSGKSPVGEWLQGNKRNGALSKLRNLGGTLQDVSGTNLIEEANKLGLSKDQFGKWSIDANKLESLVNDNGTDDLLKFVEPLLSEKSYDDLKTSIGRGEYQMSHRPTKTGATLDNVTRSYEGDGFIPEPDFYGGQWRAPRNDIDSGDSIRQLIRAHNNPDTMVPIYRAAPDELQGEAFNYGDWVGLDKKYASSHLRNPNMKVYQTEVPAKYIQFAGDDFSEYGYYPETVQLSDAIGKELDAALISPNQQTPTTAGGWLKKAGERIVEDANNRGVGLSIKKVDESLPNDARNMKVNDYNTAPETEVYRTLTGESEQPFLAYGESELGNRTRRGMVADSLERFGNTLEGAQTNVTRAAAKDLGIESTGKVVENVRKKTGITNLETQARLARELTGGEKSLMDEIQRKALTASEDGKGYKVDTTPVLNEVDAIVDKYADTNMFGSQTARNKFISNLKRDISNFDSDVLSIANRMKANAADLRGKGVASPTPADSAKAKIYSEVANKLDDLSYKAIPQSNVEDMFDVAISEMKGRAVQSARQGNNDLARAYNQLADSLSSEPRTIKAFRSFKKDFVDIARIADLTAQAENGAAAQMGRSFGGGARRLFGALAQRPVNAALAKAGGAINKVADKVAGEPTASSNATTPVDNADYNPATQVYNAIGRTEGAINAQDSQANKYISEAAQGANTPESSVAPTANAATSVYNSVYGSSATPTSTSWVDIIGSAMQLAMNAGDAAAFDQLYSMYQNALANSQKTDASQVKLSETQKRANAAMDSLERIENMTPDLGYNLSGIPLVGNIATFGGNDYEAEAKSLAQQIGYMVSGANIKEEEAYNIGKAYVPMPMDSEQTRRNKLQRAKAIIEKYQQTYAE